MTKNVVRNIFQKCRCFKMTSNNIFKNALLWNAVSAVKTIIVQYLIIYSLVLRFIDGSIPSKKFRNEYEYALISY